MDAYRASPRPCPRCATSLKPLPDDRQSCERCGGLWITDADFRELVRSMAPDLDPEAEIPFATRATAAPLPCPHCAGELRPTRFGGVPLDRCDRDLGLWLDAGELEKTLHSIGLGYAGREAQVSASISAGIPVYRQYGRTPDHAPWVPEAEPDRVGVLDLLRRLAGRPKKPEP